MRKGLTPKKRLKEQSESPKSDRTIAESDATSPKAKRLYIIM